MFHARVSYLLVIMRELFCNVVNYYYDIHALIIINVAKFKFGVGYEKYLVWPKKQTQSLFLLLCLQKSSHSFYQKASKFVALCTVRTVAQASKQASKQDNNKTHHIIS